MLTTIEEVDTLLAGLSNEEFAKDRYRRLAVERLLEILSEASRHVPQALKETVDIPWREIADLGNLLRHAYHRVDSDALWYIARNDLPPLKVVIERLILENRT